MIRIGITEFRARASSIIRRAHDAGEVVAITYRGEVIAEVSPVFRRERHFATKEEIRQHFAEFDELAAEIAKHWPKGVSAVEAVNEGRRDFNCP